MKKEDLRREFPQMPDELRAMIKEQVEQQLHGSARQPETDAMQFAKARQPENDAETYAEACQPETGTEQFAKAWKPEIRSRRRRMRPRKALLLTAAAVLAVGTTVFAGTRLYRMYLNPVGAYGTKTTVERGNSTEAETLTAAAGESGTVAEAAADTPHFAHPALRAGYLPEGMTEAEGGLQWYYEEEPYVGGISALLYQLDGEDTFELVDKFILKKEELTVNGHTCYYLTRQTAVDAPDTFDRIVYVLYPEADLVLQMHVAQNVGREELLKFMDGLYLEEQTAQEEPPERMRSWAEYVRNLAEEPETEMETERLQASAEEMEHLHQIGETFPLGPTAAEDENGAFKEAQSLSAKVVSVQVSDDLSALESAYIDAQLQEQTEAGGALKENEIQYIRQGDGIETLNETLRTERVPQKLVLAEVTYKNEGTEALYDILFFASVIKLEQEADGFRVFNRLDGSAEPANRMQCSGLGSSPEMKYYDVQGGVQKNGSNYISCLEPGQETTVHIGFVVNEDELDRLYLNLDPTSNGFAFSEQALQTGYVDIRQNP